MKIIKKNTEKGFALPLALLLLVVGINLVIFLLKVTILKKKYIKIIQSMMKVNYLIK